MRVYVFAVCVCVCMREDGWKTEVVRDMSCRLSSSPMSSSMMRSSTAETTSPSSAPSHKSQVSDISRSRDRHPCVPDEEVRRRGGLPSGTEVERKVVSVGRVRLTKYLLQECFDK